MTVFRPLTDSELSQWYFNELCLAFVPQECKPLADIRQLIENRRYEVWGLFEEGALLGYAAIWKAPDISLVLLDYLGVTETRRNAGFGSRILSLLKDQGRSIVVESELPVISGSVDENELRQRRIGFYRRNGFSSCYHMATCGMAWQALLFDPCNTPLCDVMQQHRDLYGPQRNDVLIPLPDGTVPTLPYWIK
jgi:GNAT superfamily N-acetyltransferase